MLEEMTSDELSYWEEKYFGGEYLGAERKDWRVARLEALEWNKHRQGEADKWWLAEDFMTYSKIRPEKSKEEIQQEEEMLHYHARAAQLGLAMNEENRRKQREKELKEKE